MKAHSRHLTFVIILGIILLMLAVALARAADPAPTAAASNVAELKETREKMAALHERMAACLRSDKPLADCRAEMMKGCHDTLGAQSCPMMGMGHGKDMGGKRQRPMSGAEGTR